MKFLTQTKLIFFYLLLLLGLFLRIIGLQYHGNDNYEDYRKIGSSMRNLGLVKSYGQGYWPISRYIFGASDYLSTFTPSNWWWSYKAGNLVFEIFIVITLLVFLSKHKWKVLFMYWLNPWFLVPGAWQGFWDAPYTLFMLLSIIVLDKNFKNSMVKFFLSGFLLSLSLTIKPQALAPVIVMFFYFLLQFLRKFNIREGFIYFSSLLSLPVFYSLYFWINGKPLLFLLKWYASSTRYAQTYLVNSEINIWHTITRIIMYFQGKEGPIYSLYVFDFPYNLMEYIAGLIYLVLLYVIVRIYTEKVKLPKLFFLKICTYSLILLPQIVTRSHAYHYYPASILLIILIILEKDRKLLILWLLSVIIHLYNILWQYGLGPDINLPFRLPGEPVLSILGFVSFIVTLGFIRHFLWPSKHFLKIKS